MSDFNIFQPTDAPLEGSNLIEASAGTGKTYSIAILVLRLLLEQGVPLKEILMVTFTKAAVAELEERIRRFVRAAARTASGGTIDDTIISGIVTRAIAQQGPEQVSDLLERAVLLLDDTSVMTIHSFCQQTLHEFAFETGQLFGAETLEDSYPLIEEEVNKFWRSHVTSIPIGLLKVLIENGLTRQNLSEVLTTHFGGKRYADYRDGTDFTIRSERLEEVWQQIVVLVAEVDKRTGELYTRIRNDEGGLKSATLRNRYAKQRFGELFDHPEAFVQEIKANSSTRYVADLYGDILETLDEIEAVTAEIAARSRELISRYYCWNIQLAGNSIRDFKNRNSVLSFDDMITNLHYAVVSDHSEPLLEALRQKYKAVFVDEFQDTDKMQYEIFRKVFGTETLLFYIGDPKQSIYGWRKADIATYLKAGMEVKIRYNMNINYRSSASYIDAMNLFFAPRPDFDTFGFGEAENGFDYIPVNAPPASARMGLTKSGTPAASLKILTCRNNGEIAEAAAAAILDLLEDRSWQLPEGSGSRAVTPSDIGVLVRTNRQGAQIKSALAALRIPAINIDETKILGSEEATWILYLLQAMHDPNPGRIHKALLSPITGFTRDTLLTLDEEALQEQFRAYENLWNEQGVYVAMQAFLQDFQAHAILLNGSGERGERTLANFTQLIEILHKTQTGSRRNNGELINWLQKGTEGMKVEGNEFEQRIESDEEAVRIITIHKSKGLEYNIVLAPFLDFVPEDHRKNKQAFCSFRDAASGEYLFARTDQLTGEQTELVRRQQEQENRRLIYVAITRAVFCCFVFRNSYIKDSSLVPFVTALRDLGQTSASIAFMEAGEIPSHQRYSGKPTWKPIKPRQVIDFQLEDAYWRKISYTFLAKKHPYVVKDDSHQHEETYDQFIFKQLARGTVTGNLLHYILENVDFSADRNWDRVITLGIRRFMPRASDTFASMIHILLDHVVHAPIHLGKETFQLSEVGRGQRISEFEFDFHVGNFINTDLEMLAGKDLALEVGYEEPLAGMMNGKIDLVFEHGGRYYILDWKSNFLGDDLTYYTPPQLQRAMNDSNYHLQYLLYTLALKRYLTLKIPDFNYETQFGGVIYVFMRGVRRGGVHGIYTATPSRMLIDRLEGILLGIAQPT